MRKSTGHCCCADRHRNKAGSGTGGKGGYKIFFSFAKILTFYQEASYNLNHLMSPHRRMKKIMIWQIFPSDDFCFPVIGLHVSKWSQKRLAFDFSRFVYFFLFSLVYSLSIFFNLCYIPQSFFIWSMLTFVLLSAWAPLNSLMVKFSPTNLGSIASDLSCHLKKDLHIRHSS